MRGEREVNRPFIVMEVDAFVGGEEGKEGKDNGCMS